MFGSTSQLRSSSFESLFPPLLHDLLHEYPSQLTLRLHSPTILHGFLTAGLPRRPPCLNALHDDCTTIDPEGFGPDELTWGGGPAGDVFVPGDALFFRRKAFGGAAEEGEVATAGFCGEGVVGGCEGRDEVY